MQVTDQDLEMVFLGLVGAGTFSLYGVAPDGTVVELFEPRAEISGGNQVLGSMGIAQINFADVQGDLWFTSFETRYTAAGGNAAQRVDVIVNRLSGDGVLEEEVARFVDGQSTGFQGQKFWRTAIEWQGEYTLPILDGAALNGIRDVTLDRYSVA